MIRWEKLVEVTRGPLVENEHFGALAVVDCGGTVLHAIGDIHAPVFARSGLKPLQALPVLRSGAAQAFELGDEELALCCASHSGEAGHTAVVARILSRIGCTPADLQCGLHVPIYLNLGDPPPTAPITALHHNCSGKHAGFLACCRHWSQPTEHYLDPNSRVQVEVRQAIASMAGIAGTSLVGALDGCSAPAYALPLSGLALAYARLAQRGDQHAEKIFEAMTRHPELVSGRGRTDAFYMTRRPGEIVSKVGAEGIQAIGLRSSGIGIAIKIADGSPRAAAIAALAALQQLGVVRAQDLAGAPAMAVAEVRNSRGRVTGEAREVFRLG